MRESDATACDARQWPSPDFRMGMRWPVPAPCRSRRQLGSPNPDGLPKPAAEPGAPGFERSGGAEGCRGPRQQGLELVAYIHSASASCYSRRDHLLMLIKRL